MNSEIIQRGGGRRRLIILTLEKHKDGIWILRLVQALRKTATGEVDYNGRKRRKIVIIDDDDDDDAHNIMRKEKKNSETDKGNTNNQHQYDDEDDDDSETMIIKIDVKSLEEWLSEGWMVSSSSSSSSSKNSSSVSSSSSSRIFDNVIGIVNRVSDAATPALYKACCAILGAAQHIMQIPIINGPISYGLCGNKWCHHVLFQQAKLHSPTTIAFWNDDTTTTTTSTVLQKKIQKMFIKNDKNGNDDDDTVLIKPNAGGFGAGIQRLKANSLLLLQEEEEEENNDINNKTIMNHHLPIFDDSMMLLQSYEKPRNNKLYRIWFLNGKVQCAIERRSIIINDDNDNNDIDQQQFTSGCAGSSSNVCSIKQQKQQQTQHQQPVRHKAWKVPLDVQNEIENQLLPLISDAFAGSVEFLYSSNSSSTTLKTQQKKSNLINEETLEEEDCCKRLYFDLNLLSTLPIIDDVSNEDSVWRHDYDPWIELADAIWDKFIPSVLNTSKANQQDN